MEGAYLRYLANSANTYTVTFLSEDGNTTLDTISSVSYYGNATYTGTTPTKTATAQYIYTFDGWSTTIGGDLNGGALNNIVSNKSVYAHFKKEKREYTVTFKDGDTTLHQIQVQYNASATYSGLPILPKDNRYPFAGWVTIAPLDPIIDSDAYPDTIYQQITNVQADTTCWAVYEASDTA